MRKSPSEEPVKVLLTPLGVPVLKVGAAVAGVARTWRASAAAVEASETASAGSVAARACDRAECAWDSWERVPRSMAPRRPWT